jgi:glycosyltransferase 2 family protein
LNALFADLMHFRPLQKLGILAVLGVAVHLILPQITSLENSWQVLKSLIPWAVSLAFVAQVLSYLGSGYLLQTVLYLTRESIKLWRSTLIVLGAASVGMVAGGMIGSSAAIYRWTRQEEGHPEGATLASILPSIFNNLVLVLVSLFGLVHLLLVHNLSQAQLIGFSATLLILGSIIGATIFGLQHRVRATAVMVWIASILARLRRKSFYPSVTQAFAANLFSAWDSLRSGAWREPALGAVLNVAFDMLTLFFLFVAAGHDVSLGVLLAGYGLPLLLGKMAFVVPGGVGVVEGSMAALYDGLGVPDPITVVVVLGYRLISFWLPSFSGFPIAAYLQRTRRTTHG